MEQNNGLLITGGRFDVAAKRPARGSNDLEIWVLISALGPVLGFPILLILATALQTGDPEKLRLAIWVWETWHRSLIIPLGSPIR